MSKVRLSECDFKIVIVRINWGDMVIALAN